MNKIDIAKGLIFKNLNIENNNSLEDRIIIQKKIYLLQELDINLGYSYNWYLKGPYSPSLTNYIYEKLDFLSKEDLKFSLNDNVINKINKVKSINDYIPKDLSESNWLELVASVLYIYKNSNMWEKDNSEENVLNILCEEKPRFSKENAKLAYDKLVELEYIKEKKYEN